MTAFNNIHSFHINAKLIKIAKTMKQYEPHIGKRDDEEYNKLEFIQGIWTVHKDLVDIADTIINCTEIIDDAGDDPNDVGLELFFLVDTIQECEKDLKKLEKKGLHSKLLTNLKTPQEVKGLHTGLIKIADTILQCEKDLTKLEEEGKLEEGKSTLPHVVYPMRL